MQAQAPARPSGPIIGQRTTDIRDASKELKQGGAKVASPRIVAKDPITMTGNAYVSIVGRTSILQIQQAVDLYHAANDRYPKDLDEFMTEIIKANNIAIAHAATVPEVWLRREGAQAHRPGIPGPEELSRIAAVPF